MLQGMYFVMSGVAHGNTETPIVVLDVAVHSVFGVEVSLPPSSYSFASLLGRKGVLAGARPSAAL